MKPQKFDLEHKPHSWWLRSADSYDNFIVGYVYSLGYVNSNIANGSLGVLPVCIII